MASLRNVVRFLVALVCLANPALPQYLTIGAKGGLRLTGDKPDYGVSNSRRYLVGPAVEVGLPLRFAFEIDALYSRLGNTFYFPAIGNESDVRTIADSLEFPLLLKYHLRVSRVNPFLSAGVVPRSVSGTVNTIHYGFYPGDISFSTRSWHADDRALVFGGGFGIRAGHIRITAEIRYLRWKIPQSPASDDAAYYLRPARNGEVQVLLGIGWSTS